ncbi:DNA replication/repair protein RecF [Candidatus Dependentiae bacterium]|nr:DNA replication/repair protein RecF [Candidatus Dependentiae bacterium]
MIISSIKLINFRNYENFEQNFSNGINLILGENSSGKTNLLESIYVLSNTKSFRTVRDDILVKHNNQGFYLKGVFKINSLSYTSELSLLDKSKIIKFNNDRIKKIRNYIDKIFVVLYHPSNLHIINEIPMHRRMFMNIILSKTDVEYYVALRNYFKILNEKRAALKLYKTNSINYDIIEVLNSRLSEFACKIILSRIKFINTFKDIVKEKFNSVMARNYDLKLDYKTNCADLSNYKNHIDSNSLKDEIEKHFLKVLGSEIKYCKIMTGIQSDDILITNSGYTAKFYFSQGEKKGFVLSLKLSEIEYIRNYTGHYPIVLFDDIFSELDEQRKKYLINELSRGYQAIITDTSNNPHLENMPDFKKIEIIRK